jgi:hypothetical protein
VTVNDMVFHVAMEDLPFGGIWRGDAQGDRAQPEGLIRGLPAQNRVEKSPVFGVVPNTLTPEAGRLAPFD